MAETTAPATTAAPRHKRGMLSLLASPKGLWRFLRDPMAPKGPKIAALLAVLYIVVPTDLIPDIAPILGWLDDLGLTAVAMAFVAQQAAKYQNEHENAAIGVKPVTGEGDAAKPAAAKG